MNRNIQKDLLDFCELEGMKAAKNNNWERCVFWSICWWEYYYLDCDEVLDAHKITTKIG